MILRLAFVALLATLTSCTGTDRNPCGLSGDVMTSMAQELGAAPDWEAVKAAIMAATVAVFEEDAARG